jgi:hypothetical protein
LLCFAFDAAAARKTRDAAHADVLAPLLRVQINLFLFLWTGLLLQTNPDGITENRLLFSIVVGLLTTRRVLASLWAHVTHTPRALARPPATDEDTR